VPFRLSMLFLGILNIFLGISFVKWTFLSGSFEASLTTHRLSVRVHGLTRSNLSQHELNPRPLTFWSSLLQKGGISQTLGYIFISHSYNNVPSKLQYTTTENYMSSVTMKAQTTEASQGIYWRGEALTGISPWNPVGCKTCVVVLSYLVV